MPSLPALLTPHLRPHAASRRFAGWLALFALLAGALVPTWSRLAGPEAAAAWSALCQARGGAPAAPDGAHEFGDACALCALAHTTPGLTGTTPVAVAAIAYAPPLEIAPSALSAHLEPARIPAARGPPSAA